MSHNNKEETTRKIIIAVHEGLANVYNYRIFQYLRPETCLKLETSTEKYGKMQYYVQLLGYYYNTLPGLVIYESFEDFLAMIHKQQTVDNLAAAKKAYYVVFLPKNYKSNDNEDGVGGIGGSGVHHNGFGGMNAESAWSQSSPYEDPKSRVSATHWNMIKEYNVCAMNAMNPKLPMISCFTPRLEKLSDPQKTLHSLIWITDALLYVYSHHGTHSSTALNVEVSIADRYRLQHNQRCMHLTYPYGVDHINGKDLPLRPWNKTLPYIFNTMKTCGDGLTYFDKKMSESKSKLIARKIAEENYLNDPSGIDYVTAIKGLVGCYMKMAVVDVTNSRNLYDGVCLKHLDVALKYDERDTLKCRNLKLKCLLYAARYEAYLEELKKEKFYDEKKLHRIDSTLSWNVTFCYMKLYGAEHQLTIESIKKSIQHHEYILYVLISMKATDCSNLRNQRDVTRHQVYYYEYGQFWLSHKDVFLFIVQHVLYYFLDSKSRPITKFLSSANRPFTIQQTPLLFEPQCSNTNCPNQAASPQPQLFECKNCHTTHFCSEQCQLSYNDKKHSVQCEMIKKSKRIYKHYMEKLDIVHIPHKAKHIAKRKDDEKHQHDNDDQEEQDEDEDRKSVV